MKEQIGSTNSHEGSHQVLPRSKVHLLFNLDFRFKNEREIPKLLKVQNKQLFRMILTYPKLVKFSDHFPRNLRFLKHLKFDDNYSAAILSRNQIFRTRKSLRRAQSLTHFEISGSNLNQAAALRPLVKGFKRLEYISLELCDFTTNRCILRLFSSLKSLRELKEIKLFVKKGENLPLGTLKKLSTGVIQLTSLESIDLGLSELIFDANQEDFFFDFRALKSLSSLTFKLNNSAGINNKALASLAQSLEKIQKLEKLEMNIQNCQQITNKGVEILSNSLPLSLKSLKINLDSCEEVKEKGVQSLFGSIRKMTSLEYLSLLFSSENALTDQGLLGLNLSLSGFKHLKSLHLSVLNWNLKINSLAFDEFLGILTSKTSLTKLGLQFPGWSSYVINSKRLERLGEVLANLKRIELLELNFGMRFFEDHAIDNFSNQLLALEKLQILYLDFSDCGLGSVKLLERLIKNLEKLKDLRKATLNFQHCLSRKTEEVKKILPKSLKFELFILCENTMYSF